MNDKTREALAELVSAIYEHDEAIKGNMYGSFKTARRFQAAVKNAAAALQQEVPAEPGGWQPIETAPKDETPMLLGYLPHPRMEGSRRVYEGRWNEEQNVWTSVNGFIVHRAATHWMPLPAPPAAEPAEQQEGAR